MLLVKYKKLFFPFTVILFLLLACSSGDSDSNDGESYEWKVGFNTVEDSIRGEAAKTFKKTIEEESEGDISVELFPNEELGSDNEMVESVQVGALDFQLSSSGVLAEIMPEYLFTDLPFIFENDDEAHAVLDGPYGDTLKEISTDEGIKMLNTFSIGFSQITTNEKPVEKPEDLEGVSMRSPDEPIAIDTFETLKSQVTTLPLTELYLALEQGTVDGQFNPLTAINDSKFYEVQNYLAVADINFYHAPFIMNQDLFEGLDEETQQLVQDAADEATEVAREVAAETESEMLDDIEDEFEEVTEPDKEEFQDMLEPVYDSYEEEIGKDVMEEATNTLEEYRSDN